MTIFLSQLTTTQLLSEPVTKLLSKQHFIILAGTIRGIGFNVHDIRPEATRMEKQVSHNNTWTDIPIPTVGHNDKIHIIFGGPSLSTLP